jgi:predicted esterase
MLVTRRSFLALTGGLLASAPWLPVPGSRIPTTVRRDEPFGPGQHPLDLNKGRDGILYVPKGYKPGVPAPLMVVLHGAGQTSAWATRLFPLADEFGVLLLAPDSRDERTWDMILGGFGPDVEFIVSALTFARRHVTIDPSRRTLAGFSDGASYSLSLGIGMGDVFGKVIAFSPGIMQPEKTRGKPPIFISHGTSDGVLPIGVTSRVFVPRLQKLGYDVTYREFDGRHQVPDAIAREAFEWSLRQ